MEEALRTLLGLDAEADVVEAVKALNTKIKELEAQLKETSNSANNTADLQKELLSLKNTLALRDAETDVDAAIKDGKIAPACRAEFLSFRLSQPAEFAKAITAMPAIVDLSERGSDGKGEDKGDEPSDTAKGLAKEFGLKEESLKPVALSFSATEEGEK